MSAKRQGTAPKTLPPPPAPPKGIFSRIAGAFTGGKPRAPAPQPEKKPKAAKPKPQKKSRDSDKLLEDMEAVLSEEDQMIEEAKEEEQVMDEPEPAPNHPSPPPPPKRRAAKKHHVAKKPAKKKAPAKKAKRKKTTRRKTKRSAPKKASKRATKKSTRKKASKKTETSAHTPADLRALHKEMRERFEELDRKIWALNKHSDNLLSHTERNEKTLASVRTVATQLKRRVDTLEKQLKRTKQQAEAVGKDDVSKLDRTLSVVEDKTSRQQDELRHHEERIASLTGSLTHLKRKVGDVTDRTSLDSVALREALKDARIVVPAKKHLSSYLATIVEHLPRSETPHELQPLIDYIRQYMLTYPDERIFGYLEEHGYDEQDIRIALDAARSNPSQES